MEKRLNAVRKQNGGMIQLVMDDFKISKLDRFRFDFLKKI